jgi:hypothetical protein
MLSIESQSPQAVDKIFIFLFFEILKFSKAALIVKSNVPLQQLTMFLQW